MAQPPPSASPAQPEMGGGGGADDANAFHAELAGQTECKSIQRQAEGQYQQCIIGLIPLFLLSTPLGPLNSAGRRTPGPLEQH